MLDLRPVGYVIGLLVAVLGVTMLIPLGFDLYYSNGHWPIFFECAVITVLSGTMIAIACANAMGSGRLSVQQTFLLTSGVWMVLPCFGALPFLFGATDARVVDAMFEAMSGLTTTGSTVFTGLDDLPEGLLLWRVDAAMVRRRRHHRRRDGVPARTAGRRHADLPVRGVSTPMGKVLPRAAQIASRISVVYLGLTLGLRRPTSAPGMTPFDAINHAMTTISTGGFSTYDASFGMFQGAPEYVASVFMILGEPAVRALRPDRRRASGKPLLRDPQVRGFSDDHRSCWCGDDDRLPARGQRRSSRTRLSRGAVQRHLDHLGHRLCQRRLPALGGLPGGDVLLPRADRRLRRIDRPVRSRSSATSCCSPRCARRCRRSIRPTASSPRATTAARSARTCCLLSWRSS